MVKRRRHQRRHRRHQAVRRIESILDAVRGRDRDDLDRRQPERGPRPRLLDVERDGRLFDRLAALDFEYLLARNFAAGLDTLRLLLPQSVLGRAQNGHGFWQDEHGTPLAFRDATANTLNIALGATTSRLDLNAQMLGPGSSSEMLGLYFADADQHFDHNTSQDHVSPNAFSDLLFKGALDDRSRAVFRGIIRVHPKAQQSDAYQTNRNLLLSEEASADTLPNLEIAADDVKCSHGATVGQLDEDSLFYIMSRGIPQERAERLVVMGFLGEILLKVSLGGVVEKITSEIERKLANV